jgi:DnaJ-class molecular chaperone
MASDDNPDQVSEDTPGAGEDVCRKCGGTGRSDGATCPDCDGTGKITTPIGGA